MTVSMEVVHQEIQADVAPIIANAQAMAAGVTNQEGYNAAGAYLLRVKEARKKLTDALEPFVQSAHKVWKEARKRADEFYGPVDEAEAIVKPAMAAWWEKEERERLRKQQEADLAAQKAEEERIVAEAVKAAEIGNHAAADAILEQPVMVAPVVMPAASQVKGVSMRELWQYELTDLKALIKAVAEGKVPMGAVSANAAFLGQQARSLKGEMKYPGVRVWSVKSVAAGGGR